MAEVRIMAEGTLWWVQASGSGRTWATASAPQSGLVGFTDSFSFTSARTIVTQYDRGQPSHHKGTQNDAPSVTFQMRWTGYNPVPATGTGASVPMHHLEWRSNEAENAGSGRYFQFYGGAQQQTQVTENADGNTFSYTYNLLGMNGPTGSGYLS